MTDENGMIVMWKCVQCGKVDSVLISYLCTVVELFAAVETAHTVEAGECASPLLIVDVRIA